MGRLRWSALQGPFPTHLQIQDVARRVMEFILDLDIGKARREMADVRVRLRDALSKWSTRREDLLGSTKNGCRITGVPIKPTPEFLHNPAVTIEYFHSDRWVTIDEARTTLRAGIASPQVVQTASSQAPEIEQELLDLRRRLGDVSLRQEQSRVDEQAQRQQQLAVQARLADLRTDLERNKDALKLKNLGSLLGSAASEHHCPTCHQGVQSELMPSIIGAGMAIDMNIEFIKSQLVLYEASAASAEREFAELQSLAGAMQQQSTEIRSRIRVLRQTLIQPSDSPSIAALEAAITAQAKIDDINSTQERADAAISDLVALAREHVDLDRRLCLVLMLVHRRSGWNARGMQWQTTRIRDCKA
jgi:hypothetical protein